MGFKENEKKEDAIAKERTEKLLSMAIEKFLAGDEVLSKRYVQIARRLAMRHRLKLGAKRFCKKCGVIFIEGQTVKTRIIEKKPWRVCAKCGAKRMAGVAKKPLF